MEFVRQTGLLGVFTGEFKHRGQRLTPLAWGLKGAID